MKENSPSTKLMVNSLKHDWRTPAEELIRWEDDGGPNGIDRASRLVEQSFTRLMLRYRPTYLKVAKECGVAYDRIDELVQIFIMNRILEKSAILRYSEQPGSHFQSWLKVVFKRFVLDQLDLVSNRRAGVGGSANMRAVQSIPTRPSDDARMNLIEILNHIRPSIDPEKFNAFERNKLENESLIDIATTLNVSRKTVGRWVKDVVTQAHAAAVELGLTID